MSDLLKLDAISKRNGDIKAFVIPGNLKSANHGKSIWGQVTIVIDAISVNRLMEDDVIGVLYIVGKDDWNKECSK